MPTGDQYNLVFDIRGDIVGGDNFRHFDQFVLRVVGI
jgi:hypothetical protein